ncbi:sulfatase-like hydrolase/transferase [Novipirellula artificiosorum]|uniref:Arylsulfatase n=1 Tax=Novipirellula artificiosorum TaxID=2528016 RepID=A0A5C6D8X6_9BACT|nr:sulfatase-like hydrolase/transferase [Novipirellula artificiosorum]TWU32244.1 Arylsulfatase precursor [Novipirellula artificiosorum]
MNNSFSVVAGAFLASLALIALATDTQAAADRPPNILFILTDDQGYGDLGCYGSTTIDTPNIDRLCAEGMKFESFYVHNRCSPTRAALMTGCHAHRVGVDNVVYRRERIGLHADEITIAELLQKAGYSTGMVGKWHLGEWDAFNPVNHGFASFFGFMESGEGKSTAIYRNREIVEHVKGKTDGVHSPKLLAAGIDFIRASKNRPFFLYYASPLPHTKWIPNERFAGTSKHGTYGDVVQEIDWQVGELMETLDELGIAENTLVIFASDNGPQLNVEGYGSAGVLRDGKWTNFEGGIRVPCNMRWPSVIPAGSMNNEITGIIDMLPTFCALAGVDVPSDRVIDGRNILPYMRGEDLDSPIHETFIVPGATVRHGDWKLLVKGQSPGGGKSDRVGKTDRIPAKAGSLFNLNEDLGETTDLSAQHPEKVQELTKTMNVFMEELETNSRPVGELPSISTRQTN